MHGVQKSEGAEDDDNVTLEQFTHMVVRMFEQFFRILDRTEAGYLTQVRHCCSSRCLLDVHVGSAWCYFSVFESNHVLQEDLRQVFSDQLTGDVTGALRSAISELDADGDGGVSLNELLRVGLAGVSSRSSAMNLQAQVGTTQLLYSSSSAVCSLEQFAAREKLVTQPSTAS